MSEQDLRDALWSLHEMEHDSEEDEVWCASCGVIWPCPTAEVLQHDEASANDEQAAQAVAALEGLREWAADVEDEWDEMTEGEKRNAFRDAVLAAGSGS